jgi:hypothetical protein
MKRSSSFQKPLLIVGSIFILGIILFFSTCVLMLAFKNLSLSPSVEVATQFPTITPVPLPDTIEEIKSDCSKGECLQACMAHANNEIQQRNLYLYKYVEEDIELVYYGISDEDELTNPRLLKVQTDLLPFQQNKDAHETIWNYFKAIIPRELRPNLVTLIVYISSTSNGMFDITGTENWITEINILALEDAPTLSSVIGHEYSHYLTLNTTQRLSWNQITFCRQEPLFGCQKPDSYINLFYVEFWEDIYPEWEKIDWQSRHYEEEIGLFYQKYEDRFLNNYAATDPIEDIAESWEAFVLDPIPSGDSIAEQKIKFFYEFPELVQLRYQIIKGICTFELTQ